MTDWLLIYLGEGNSSPQGTPKDLKSLARGPGIGGQASELEAKGAPVKDGLLGLPAPGGR
jgi:hypothetical protein